MQMKLDSKWLKNIRVNVEQSISIQFTIASKLRKGCRFSVNIDINFSMMKLLIDCNFSFYIYNLKKASLFID